MKKPRSDSKLKGMTDEQQALIAEWVRVDGVEKAMERVRMDFGVEVSASTFYEFLSWLRMRQRFSRARERSEQVAEMVKERAPGLSSEKVRALAQDVFTLEALDSEDAKTFVALQQLRLSEQIAETTALFEREKIEIRKAAETRSREALELERQKFRRTTCELYLKWSEDEEAKRIAGSSATNSEKIEQLGLAMFGEDWNA